ncbi:MAG TPA: peptidoglycan editing factor PgeF [Anaerolineae bacterium]|nr:peptidoglycan editing factor PgeF [Anaerolineae bacterium]
MNATLPLLRFPCLSAFPGLVHAVSTRQGGVSNGPYASLNLSTSTGDSRENVDANYHRLAQALDVPREHMTTTWQVHGTHVVCATAGTVGGMLDKADGIITDTPGLPLTQRYADCTPLIVYDPLRHAAGLGHAGWRGTVAGMATALVQAMTASFGSDPGDLIAVVGPAIGPCCYEIGPEVVEAVRMAFPAADTLLHSRTNGASSPASPHFDLWAANRWQLEQAGVGQIEVAGICTRCQRETFFSHRGDGARTGRFGAVVMLRG